MAKCLRCGATDEWIEGRARPADASRIHELEAALKELLVSQQTPIPPFEAGKAAQDAWADRRARARNDAAYLLGESDADSSNA